MSATQAPVVQDREKLYRPGLVRLTTVELRKMVDTRSGFWLLLIIGLISVLGVTLGVFTGGPADHTLQNFYQLTIGPLSLVLPVLGVLLVTTEWSQRTALTTFSLVPRRGRVVVAKILAAALLSLLAGVVGLAAAFVGYGASVATGRTDGTDYALSPGAVGGGVLYLVIVTMVGLGLGMLLLNSPAAIVLNFVLPNLLTGVLSAFEKLQDLLIWIDLNSAAVPLSGNDMTGERWSHLGTSVLFWIALPMGLGAWRVLTREVK